MKLGSNVIIGALGMAVLSAAAITWGAGQATPAKKPAAAQAVPATKIPATGIQRRLALPVGTAQHPLLAKDAFHNIQVMGNIPATQFMDVMGFFSASLVETCTYCHSDESCGNWDLYAQDTNPLKNEARAMVRMTNNINKTYFAGQQVVTCFSCHWGAEEPKSTPELKLQYEPPPLTEPEVIQSQDPNSPPPMQLIDKYIEAIGGAQKVGALKSYESSGTYQAYSASEQGTVDIYAKAPNQLTRILHTASGDSTIVYNGLNGWQAGPDDLTPLPVVALSGSDLDGYRTDAELFFASQIKKSLTHWKTGTPFTVNGSEANVVQGIDAGGAVVKLYFDKKTNYLLREQRYIKTYVGYNPYEIDYSDYRDVDGIMTPFHLIILWTDGRSTIQLNKIQWNVPIEASHFAQPKAPKPLPNDAELLR